MSERFGIKSGPSFSTSSRFFEKQMRDVLGRTHLEEQQRSPKVLEQIWNETSASQLKIAGSCDTREPPNRYGTQVKVW